MTVLFACNADALLCDSCDLVLGLNILPVIKRKSESFCHNSARYGSAQLSASCAAAEAG